MDPKLSIADLINEQFKSKPQGKRDQWISTLQNEEIETVEELIQASENIWNALSLPLLIKEQLKQKIFENSSSIMTDQERAIIINLLNSDITAENIMKTLDVKQGSQKFESINTFILSLIQPPKPLPTNCKSLSVKLKEEQLPIFHYKSSYDPLRKYFTLLVIGETGSGKTTLLDAFVNYLTLMAYTDNWRWKLVDESEFKNKHISISQTTQITSYYVNDVRNKFNIRIIDTPGFGDTQGVDKDQQTVKQFEKLFKEITEIDYILITTQSSQSKLTPGTKYVYDRVQQIFGKDAAERFVLMCTFADGGIPQAITTLENFLTFEEYFPFNNSALYIPSHKGTTQTKFFWKMAMESVEKFSQFVIEKNRLPLSLTLSKQVLEFREYLHVQISTSQEKISICFEKLDDIQNLIQQIDKNKKIIDDNGTFTYMEKVDKFEDKPLNGVYQRCIKCNKTCCQICVWPNDKTESQCTYFSGEKGCPRCSNCPKSSHVRTTVETIRKQVLVPMEYKHKKDAFNQGKEGLKKSEQAIEQQKSRLKLLANEILVLMKNVKDSIAMLDKIAMKPRIFTDVEYFEQMIQYEKDTKESGYTQRVKQLEQMLKHARDINLMHKSKDVKDLFPQYKKLIDDDKICVIF